MKTDSSPARRDALALLARRAHSTGELTNKLLAKGHAPCAIDEAVEWLSALDYLDDEAYARDRMRGCAARGYGVYRVRGALLARALDAELVERVLEELPPAEDAIASLIARLSAGKDLDDPKQRRRLADALARRGFRWGEIERGMQEFIMHHA